MSTTVTMTYKSKHDIIYKIYEAQRSFYVSVQILYGRLALVYGYTETNTEIND